MNLVERDLKHIWHPCSQMKDYEGFPPLEIAKAYGSYLELTNGKTLIDAISSWWCKSLGHGHPRLKAALSAQMEKFEHVILANTTNETIVTLSEKLATLVPNLDKLFYAGDGSSAVEIAIKMSLHSRKITGSKKNKFMALANGYHGETVMTLALGDLGIYKQDYEDLFPETAFIQNIPYVSSKNDPKWKDCSEEWEKIEPQLDAAADSLSAILFEPILQGAGGMLIYSADFLNRLDKWAKANNVHLIADEIMTGFGRTGDVLACNYTTVKPDFVCISKGFTSGWLPMSAVLTSSETYNLFYDDYEKQKSFLHSNTYTGNALAASVAIETLAILEEEIYPKSEFFETCLYETFMEVVEGTKRLENIRYIGGVVAADLILPESYKSKRMGFEIYKKATSFGALLRPLGNTIYWLPPLNTSEKTLKELRDITIRSIQSVF
mgnify:CR=1 FL=1